MVESADKATEMQYIQNSPYFTLKAPVFHVIRGYPGTTGHSLDGARIPSLFLGQDLFLYSFVYFLEDGTESRPIQLHHMRSWDHGESQER